MARGSQHRGLFAWVAVIICAVASMVWTTQANAQIFEPALARLIEQAKKEPRLIDGSMTRVLLPTPPLIKRANEMFNKAFGMDKTITIVEGTDNTFTSQMMAALDVGGAPKLAFYTTNGGNIHTFIGGNYIAPVTDWKTLLAAVNPRVKSGTVKPEDISREGYAGYAFAHSNRLKGIGYNRNLITLKDLPKTYADMANDKYKGQYAIEPWTSHWEALGSRYYPGKMDEFLKVIHAIGKNTYVVGRSHQMIPRMAQGEIRFMTLNAEVVVDFAQSNPGAPLDYYFMDDLTLVETTMMFVPRKSPAPATGLLWVMYLSHPDVQALRGPDAPNIMYGELPLDRAMQDRLKGKNPWDWQMNAATKTYWQWINDKSNGAFRRDLTKAVRQRR